MSIALGWWIVPAAITFAALLWAVWVREPHPYGSHNDLVWLLNMFWYLLVSVIALAAWLIWSLLQS